MEGIIFPLIMIVITLVGGGIFFFFVEKSNKKTYTLEEELSMKTAQEFINVKNIKDRFLYTMDGLTIMYVRLQSISIDLYSETEKQTLSRQLTTELSDITYSFKFMALSRPVDIVPLIQTMTETSRMADDIRRSLLNDEIKYLSNFTVAEDIVERQFYVSIWDKTDQFNETELVKRANLLAEKYTSCGVSADIIGESEIIKLMNFIFNPAYTAVEDTDFKAAIPFVE